MLLLDTNVVSELRKVEAGRADRNVAAWSDTIDISDLFLSAISIQELETGVLLAERRDADQGAVLRKWLENSVLAVFHRRILPVDTDVALTCAALHVPNARPANDALICATALVHGMTVVTRNVADFSPMGVALFNPWD